MDDLKLLGRNENYLKNEIKIVQTISKDINFIASPRILIHKVLFTPTYALSHTTTY
jgi:hypothetical protein